MGIRLGINGFGRIGRQVARIVADLDQIDLLAVNDPADSEAIVHLFKYDSTYGRFKGQVELAGGEMIVNGHRITVLQEPDPVNVKWSELGVDYVLEATGKFSTLEDCEVHLANGAKRVVLSAPSKGAMPTYVYGVNHEQWISDGKPGVISNASCTTNCLAPLLKVLNDNFTVQRGLMGTVHSYTNDQHLLDHNHKHIMRPRSAAP
ncbi:aldehyde dehydrogenase, partial [bacterium]|nr:aldehyde dehydrogenase [bacterium]